MRLSVALAAYNGEKFIIEQLESIRRQTRPVDEVIIVDDGSRDDTAGVVERFLNENHLSDWCLIVNRENLGYAENFRRAIDACTGELIFLCDQDDIWVRDRAEVMAEAMETDPGINVLNTRMLSFGHGEAVPEDPKSEPDGRRAEKIGLSRRTFFLKYPGCVMCVRRSFYEKAKKFWRTGWAQDDFFWCLSMLYDSCYEMPYVSLLRRVHDSQTSGKVGHSREKRIGYLEGVVENCGTLIAACTEAGGPVRAAKLYKRVMRAHRYRLELVRDRRLARAVPLIAYLGYYDHARSYPVELMLALKGD